MVSYILTYITVYNVHVIVIVQWTYLNTVTNNKRTRRSMKITYHRYFNFLNFETSGGINRVKL